MQNDKQDLEDTCKDLLHLEHSKSKVTKQNHQYEEEFEILKSIEEAKYKSVVENLVKSQNRMREQEQVADDLDMKRRDKEK